MINRLAKRIILLVNWMVIFLLLLGFLAGKISPAIIPYLSYFGLAFHVIAVINLGFIIFWLLFRKYYFLYSLIALFLVYQPLSDTFHLLSKNKTYEFGRDFSVMSFNVKVFDLYNWRQNKKSRDEIFTFIRSVGPDIGCFQEYFNSSNNYFPVHDSLMKNQKFKYAHIFYSDKLSNGHNFGIATYSRFPIVNKMDIPFIGTHNLAIASDIKIGDDTLRIINCHLQSVRFLKEDYQFIDSLSVLSEEERIKGAKGVLERLKAAARIRASQTSTISKQITTSPYPVMLCGDFNDVPASYTYQKLSENLEDSFEQYSLGMGGTYGRFFPPLRIDYVLYQSPIQCKSFRLFRVNLSDHYPVYGTYSLP